MSLSDIKQEMDNNGFIVLKSVFKESELEPIRLLVEQIINSSLEKDPFNEYYFSHRIDQGVLYDLFQRYAEFQDLAKNVLILDAIEQLIGPDILLYVNSLVFKPSGKNNAVPWHQDFMSQPDNPIKYIAWIALDNVDEVNGSMSVLPGSHKLGFLPYTKTKGETHHTRAIIDDVNFSDSHRVNLCAGDVLIFHQLLLHSSDQVDSDIPRRAYRIAYQNTDKISVARGAPIALRRKNSVIL